MLGYGLVNSSVHELCLTEIIFSFLSRSSMFLSMYYYNLYSINTNAGKIPDEELDKLIKLFFEEEKLLYKLSLKESGVPDSKINEEEILYKYILSANIIHNQNYDYDSKDLNKVIEDGKVSLRDLFYKNLLQFFNFLKQDTANSSTIPNLQFSGTQSDNYLLSLIKYSTFIFESNSLIRKLFPGNRRIGTVGTNPGFCEFTSQFRAFYMTLGGLSEQFEYSEFNPQDDCTLKEKPNFNYFSTGGKFFNYGRPAPDECNISPFLFGEFYYSMKPEKIGFFVSNYLKGSKLFSDYQDIFSDYKISQSLKSFGLFLPGGYDTEEILLYDQYKNKSISKGTILKYYKFSFRELRNFISQIRFKKELLNDKFEDYFDLNYRVMLNFTADITKNDSLENHQIFKLSNAPYKEDFNLFPPYIDINSIPHLNGKFLFKIHPIKDVDKGYEDFISPFAYEGGFTVPYFQEILDTYQFLAGQTKNLKIQPSGFYDPNDNLLIKMLFKKETIVVTTDNLISLQTELSKEDPYYSNYSISKYDSFLSNEDGFSEKPYKCGKDIKSTKTSYIDGRKLEERLKINYFLTLADFKVDVGSSDIYFSNYEIEGKYDDPSKALYNIKANYYLKILEQLKDAVSKNPKFETLINNLNYSEIEKLFSATSGSEMLDTYINDIKNDQGKIIPFYRNKLNDAGTKVTLLAARDSALNILDQQIKVLQNG